MTQSELASATGRSLQMVRNYEKGHPMPADVSERIVELARERGVSLPSEASQSEIQPRDDIERSLVAAVLRLHRVREQSSTARALIDTLGAVGRLPDDAILEPSGLSLPIGYGAHKVEATQPKTRPVEVIEDEPEPEYTEAPTTPVPRRKKRA